MDSMEIKQTAFESACRLKCW